MASLWNFLFGEMEEAAARLQGGGESTMPSPVTLATPDLDDARFTDPAPAASAPRATPEASGSQSDRFPRESAAEEPASTGSGDGGEAAPPSASSNV